MSLETKIEGGLIGLLVGDALGVPYEFHKPLNIPKPELIGFEPPHGFDRAHPGVPPGTWSDDGAQALCLLASLLTRGEFDAHDFGNRLQNWRDYGYMAVGGKVFDIGFTTNAALNRLQAGSQPLDAGPSDERSNGNGSLMRVLPLALWHVGPDEELVRYACAQSRVTHGHPRSQVCCALYCLWTRRYLQEHADPWDNAVSTLRSIAGTDSLLRDELEREVRPDETVVGTGTGYVIDSLHSTRQLMVLESFEAIVRGAVGLGFDTDTTACIAGGLAGVRFGRQGIPMRWQNALRGKDLYTPLLEELLEHHR
ncbi:MAG: ADP-ribosylglycohydrolase family protein [Pseudomonadota bacterium]